MAHTNWFVLLLANQRSWWRSLADQENAMTYFSQRGAEIHSGRRFAHTAFLISDRDDLHKSE